MLPPPRLLRLIPGVFALGLAACALPSDPLSGLEVSWSATEREASDGDEGLRLRTCAGARIRRVELELRDLDDEGRHEVFSYPCELGYQTADEVATLPSSVFFDLRAGTYEVVARAISEVDGEAIAGPSIEVTVSDHGVERIALEVAPPLVPWRLEITGQDACASASASLRYAEPATDLVGAEEGDAGDARYRDGLVGDQGLALDGAPAACDGPWASAQRFELDPGRYLLEVEVDGRRCTLPLELGPLADASAGAATTTLDLAKLPCDG
ncbi:MAG: hypothetical protein KC420_12280 [Myxococcales bacterium]|nr:hypothetical protein [Myxococcales bacterium]MCB9703964.1 hypothetical protein [Myxococcales bacterium]